MAYRKAPNKLSEAQVAAIQEQLIKAEHRSPTTSASPAPPSPKPAAASTTEQTDLRTTRRSPHPTTGRDASPTASTGDTKADAIARQADELWRVGTTRAPGPAVQTLRPLLVPLVARCLFPRHTAENTLRWMFAAAAHIEHDLRRPFELAMFTEHNLAEWAQEAMGHLESKTRHSGKRAIQRVLEFDEPDPEPVERGETLRPYSPRQLHVAESEAAAIGDERWGTVEWGTSWRNLIDLTAHAGARPSEALRVVGADIDVSGPRTTVNLVNDQGVVRRVPVLDEPGRRLARQADTLGALVYNRQLRKRRAATDRLRKWALKHGYKRLAKFRITRARHAWITELISMDVSLRVVCTLADLNAGTSAITDLASYQPAVHDRNVLTALERARQNPTLPIIGS